MCGRFANDIPAAEAARIFGTSNAVPNYPPRYNVAPTQGVLAVRYNPDEGQRHLDVLRRGLAPIWADDLSIGNKLINARAEGIADKPAFRDAFAKRRCLIPASGFYEWKKVGTTKQPFAIVPNGEPLFAFAGLWERWKGKKSGEITRTCAIITGLPNALIAPIHNRMPVILDQADWRRWLGEDDTTKEDLLFLLKPYPAEKMRVYPVSARVNSPKNDAPELLEAV